MKRMSEMVLALLALSTLTASGCSSCSGDKNESDGGTDMDANPDADADTDTDSDTDTDTDTDADSDSDTDTDSDSDTDSGLPSFCDILSPANENGYGWSGRRAMDDGYVVWRWIDADDTAYLMKRNLETEEQSTLLVGEYPDTIETPTISGNNVFFSRQPGGTGPTDVFQIGLSESTEANLTNTSSIGEYETVAGDTGVLYNYSNLLDYPENVEELRYYDLTSSTEYIVFPDQAFEEPYSQAIAFGGTRWVVWGTLDMDQSSLYKWDAQNPTAPMQFIEDIEVGGGEVNDERSEYISVVNSGGDSTRRDIAVWDLETNARSLLIDDPWDQIIPDYDGNVVVYLDSQAEEVEASGGVGEIRVADRDTDIRRVVLPFDTYYSTAIWSHFIAVNNFGLWGDSLIVCNLLEGGIMNASGHVCPESGCDGDAGVDGGK